MTKPKIVGHRANHIKTILYYIKENTDYIELDLKKKRQKIIVSHGEPLASATTLTELIVKLILNSILKKDHLLHPLTLDEALEKIPITTGLWLDIKSREIGLNALERILKKGYTNIVVSTNYYGISKDVKKKWPQIKTAISVSFEPMTPDELIELSEKANADIIAIEHTYITQQIVETLHNYGREIAVWTVNSPKYAKKILSIKPDYLITDRPDLIRNIL